MTVSVYEAPPGSGKGIHATETGLVGMNRPGGVLANYPIVRPKVRKDGTPKWIYVPTEDLDPELFMDHAERYHKDGAEGQGLIIIDECHRVLNSRTTWTGRREVASRQYRLVQWLAESRHWGFDVVLVIQNLLMLDKQVRDELVQYRVKHFKWNSMWFLTWCPVPLFGRVTYNEEFRTMKGRLGFSTGLMAYGRYDHLWQRKAARVLRDRRRQLDGGAGAFAPEALAPATSLVLSVGTDAHGDVRVPEDDVLQVVGGRSLVPEALVPAALVVPVAEGVEDHRDLVAGEDAVLKEGRVAYARLVHDWRAFGSGTHRSGKSS